MSLPALVERRGVMRGEKEVDGKGSQAYMTAEDIEEQEP